MSRQYVVYIMTNPTHRVLYIGVTGNFPRRIQEHRNHTLPGFTARYHCVKCVYAETTEDVHAALSYEKRLKGWSRQKKIDLIHSVNPEWRDLGDDVL